MIRMHSTGQLMIKLTTVHGFPFDVQESGLEKKGSTAILHPGAEEWRWLQMAAFVKKSQVPSHVHEMSLH